jgi:hypothetical protein
MPIGDACNRLPPEMIHLGENFIKPFNFHISCNIAFVIALTIYWPTANTGYKWILMCIDGKGYAYALKNKEQNTVLDAFKLFTKQNIKHPLSVLISDNGSEFINNEFQKNLNQLKIQHQTAEPGYHPTLGVVDAFSKNVKNALFRYFTEYDTTKWIDVLDTVIDNYNNTPHSGIANYAPNEVHLHEEEIEDLNIAKNQNATVGDTVRRKLKENPQTDAGQTIRSSEC